MAIPIKIECGCGQNYAFDVEPVGGRLPSAVACPSCGVDGTELGNSALSRASIAPTGPRLATRAPSSPAPAPIQAVNPLENNSAPLDLTSAIADVRSKIMWGDSRQQAIVCLYGHGVAQEEANQIVTALMKERSATLRKNGMGKIIIGTGMMCVPVVTFIFFLIIKIMLTKVLGLTLMVGAAGFFMTIKGIFMVVAPRAETGDANQ